MQKLKRIFFILTIYFIAAMFFNYLEAHVDDKIEFIEISAEVQDDGCSLITEKWYVNSMERFSYFKFYQGLKPSNIKSFVVIDENGTEYENIGNWDISMANDKKIDKCGINTREDGIELCWGVESDGFHTFTLQYEVTGFVKQFQNGKGIEFNFIDERNKSNSYSN